MEEKYLFQIGIPLKPTSPPPHSTGIEQLPSPLPPADSIWRKGSAVTRYSSRSVSPTYFTINTFGYGFKSVSTTSFTHSSTNRTFKWTSPAYFNRGPANRTYSLPVPSCALEKPIRVKTGITRPKHKNKLTLRMKVTSVRTDPAS